MALNCKYLHQLVFISTSEARFKSNNLVCRLVEDEEPVKAVIDDLNQPLFKTESFPSDISSRAEIHRMKLPLLLLILERAGGKSRRSRVPATSS